MRLVALAPMPLLSGHLLDPRRRVSHHLDRAFYNLSTVALHDWQVLLPLPLPIHRDPSSAPVGALPTVLLLRLPMVLIPLPCSTTGSATPRCAAWRRSASGCRCFHPSRHVLLLPPLP